MSSEQLEMILSPIGHVSVDKEGFALRINAPYRPALRGLEGFSHIDVLWWCNQLDGPEYRHQLECNKPYKKGPAKLGVFATRSPVRPNPVALTMVQVLVLDANAGIITVPFIDAVDGTPIIDLKPYHPCADRIRSVSVPEWCSHWPQWYEDSAHFDWQAEFMNAR